MILDQLFVPVRVPERLRAPYFFGEFVLNGQAKMANVGAIYGLKLPPRTEEFTAAEYIVLQLHTPPVVGDRVHIGAVELVVREIEADQVTKVGFKLPH